MKKLVIFFFILCLSGANHFSWGRAASPTTHLKVLQMNIWQEGTMVEGGFEAIANEIVHTDADLVFFSEVRNYKDKKFIPRILEALHKRGSVYYGEHSSLDVGILSKYKIESQEEVRDAGSILRATFRIGKHTIAAYSAHLDYKNYACYLPRGYNGATWKKMDAPVNNADTVLVANRIARRDESIGTFLQAVQKDIAQGNLILFGGDFNEPSHLDWQADTRNLWDHNNLVINWDCSVMLYDKGFKDVYRVLHPNPVTHPGFTFPSDNKSVSVDKLTWAPDADERDRIDFIYYYPNKKITPISSVVVGPSTSIVRSQRMEESSQDSFLLPQEVWPSDHKAVLAIFSLKK